MLSEDEEEEAIAGSEVGSVPGSVVGMVRTVPDVSDVGTILLVDSASESEPPVEKLQASDTNKGRMRAKKGILELCDIFYSLMMNRKELWNANKYNKYDNKDQLCVI